MKRSRFRARSLTPPRVPRGASSATGSAFWFLPFLPSSFPPVMLLQWRLLDVIRPESGTSCLDTTAKLRQSSRSVTRSIKTRALLHLCVALAGVVVCTPTPSAMTIAQAAASQPSIRERLNRVGADRVLGGRSHQGSHPGAQGDPRSRAEFRRGASSPWARVQDGGVARDDRRSESGARSGGLAGPLLRAGSFLSRQHVSRTGTSGPGKGRNGERPDPGAWPAAVPGDSW